MKTHVAIVLDKSGSMYATREQTIALFNEQVQQMKLDAADQEILVSLITFNGNVYEHIWDVSVDQIQEIGVLDYVPSGSTAMRDAMGYTIQKYMDTTDVNEPDTAYLIIAISDGHTNSDKQYNVAALREMIDSCNTAGNFTFTYLGCSEDYLNELSSALGTTRGNAATWDNSTSRSVKFAACETRKCTEAYFNDRKRGVTSKLNYMSLGEDDKVANFVPPAGSVDEESVVGEATIPGGPGVGDVAGWAARRHKVFKGIADSSGSSNLGTTIGGSSICDSTIGLQEVHSALGAPQIVNFNDDRWCTVKLADKRETKLADYKQ